jgi:hypothetical protein
LFIYWLTKSDYLGIVIQVQPHKRIGISQSVSDVFLNNLIFVLQEASIREERERATDLSVKAGSAASRELNQLREELTQLKKEAQRNAEKVTKVSST